MDCTLKPIPELHEDWLVQAPLGVFGIYVFDARLVTENYTGNVSGADAQQDEGQEAHGEEHQHSVEEAFQGESKHFVFRSKNAWCETLWIEVKGLGLSPSTSIWC